MTSSCNRFIVQLSGEQAKLQQHLMLKRKKKAFHPHPSLSSLPLIYQKGEEGWGKVGQRLCFSITDQMMKEKHGEFKAALRGHALKLYFVQVLMRVHFP